MAATPQQPAAPPQTDRGTQGQWAVGECVGEQACLCLCLSGRPWPSLDYSLGLSASCEGESREREMELDFSPPPQSSLEQRLRD